MQPVRKVIDDAPDFISAPEELRHRKIELIIWPLGEEPSASITGLPQYRTMRVDSIVIPPRDERHAR